MKIIIVGCGRVGSRVALELCGEGHDITIIDRNILAFDKLGVNTSISVIAGTGIDCGILESAGIKEVDALISLTKGDNTNIMVAQIAKFLFKVPKVVTRIVDPKVKSFYETEMGLTCYCQTEISSTHYISMLKGDTQICTLL